MRKISFLGMGLAALLAVGLAVQAGDKKTTKTSKEDEKKVDEKKPGENAQPGARQPGRRPGGQGGFGGFGGRSTPGQIFSTGIKDQLKLTDEQKKQLEDLQKDVDAKVAKILTDDQKKSLKEISERRPGGGFGGQPGGPGGRRPGGAGGRPGGRPPMDNK